MAKCAVDYGPVISHSSELWARCGIFAFCSLKTREKFTNWDNLVCLSLYIFWVQSHVYLRKYFGKVNIDRAIYKRKKYTNWDKLSCLSLYIFLSFWRRRKPNIPYLKLRQLAAGKKHHFWWASQTNIWHFLFH